jgi:ABC-type glycerol-3-phosphate transport system substrate-binding protein
MRPIIALLAVAAALAGCGVETMSAAATAAAAKKHEIEQGKKTMEQMQQNIGKSMEQTQQSVDRADDAAK